MSRNDAGPRTPSAVIATIFGVLLLGHGALQHFIHQSGGLASPLAGAFVLGIAAGRIVVRDFE